MLQMLLPFQKWIIVGILISLLTAAAYYYYNSTQQRIQDLIEQSVLLQENARQLRSANEKNLETIDTMQENFDEVVKNYKQTQDEFQVIRLHHKELRERLAERQLSELAAEKTVLVERTINKAADNTMRCFELLSGSPLTEKEKNAKTEREFNSECPWLYGQLVNP